VLLIGICTVRAASHPTLLNVTGILLGTIWLVLALRSAWNETPDSMRSGGLTPGMELAMNRALAEKQSAQPDLPNRSAAPLEPPQAWQVNDSTQRPQPKTDSTKPGAPNSEAPKDDLPGKVKFGGREICQVVMNGLKDKRGIHIESLLTCLGALAGYACQACVRENNARAGVQPPESGLAVASGADGRKYFFGDPLNKPLAESRYSVWSLTAGAIQQLGKPLPDLEGIFKHVAATVGGAEFGIPRIPEGHRPGDLPLNFLKVIWPQILPIARKYCEEPDHLPIVFGLAVQHAILMSKGVIDPTLAGTIAMECAVPMSKVDLG
jgi:hypothetical protein